MDREINQYKIVVPLLVQHVLQHVLHQLKAQQFYAIFVLILMSSLYPK